MSGVQTLYIEMAFKSSMDALSEIVIFVFVCYLLNAFYITHGYNFAFTQIKHKMRPWRPGNYNMPSSTKNSKGNVAEGVDHDPDEGEDSYLPTVNIHYDYKPQDWLAEERKLNQTIQLHRDLTDAARHYAEDQRRLRQSILQRESLLYNILRQVPLKSIQSRNVLPQEFLTGSVVQDPVKMNILRSKVMKEWSKVSVPKKEKKNINPFTMENDFRDVDYPLHMAKDIYTQLSDQFLTA